jgi:RNA polymerase sigma-70 factor (ECF subfamily)
LTDGNTQDLGATAELLSRVRAGDESARDALFRRYLPLLQRWAHGQLRGPARSLAETDDLVQSTLVQTLRHVEAFQPRREGAFVAYLRQILLNEIRQEVRRASRRPSGTPLEESLPDPRAPDPAEQAVTDTYERALAHLTKAQREAVILRVEFGYSHEEVADAIGSKSADAARMLVTRALVRLAEFMRDDASSD